MEPKRTHVLGYQEMDVAPHAQAQRVILSNETNRVYRVTNVFLLYERSSAAATPGVVEMRVGFTESGRSEVTIGALRYTGNTVNQRGTYTLPSPVTVWKGDTLSIYTSDSSTGGTVNYWVAVVYEVI